MTTDCGSAGRSDFFKMTRKKKDSSQSEQVDGAKDRSACRHANELQLRNLLSLLVLSRGRDGKGTGVMVSFDSSDHMYRFPLMVAISS
jgi:hypothetical protein